MLKIYEDHMNAFFVAENIKRRRAFFLKKEIQVAQNEATLDARKELAEEKQKARLEKLLESL